MHAVMQNDMPLNTTDDEENVV